jgi:hypothetical protein
VNGNRAQKRVERKRILRNRRRRIERRLRDRVWSPQDRPMFRAGSVQYELAERARGLSAGGIGAMHLLARRTGLIEAIDRRLHLLKVHLPYHESDHVLNVAYNILAGGTCLQDLELFRNNESYLDALGAPRIPDPTTAGDFCRRFTEKDVETLQDTINEVRVKVWQKQPAEFFQEAVIDVDGHLARTWGECKEGMALSYKGVWGYHPLIVSLANTQEPLYLVNRPGNRPSHEGAAEWIDRSIARVRQAGFQKIWIRGDTDFTQTTKLDAWDADGVRFLFGIDAMPNLIDMAENVPDDWWKPLPRKPKYTVKTKPRAKPENVKERIVVEKGYENIKLKAEEVAEFDYQPTACKRSYTVIVVRKHLSVEKGQEVLFPQIRYFFYITNDRRKSEAKLVDWAHQRCHQENLIEQLKNGVHAMNMPVQDLVSNGAYLVMAALAWTLKAWFALLLPETGRWAEKHREQKRSVLRMEFKGFLNAFLKLPCQIVRTGRRIVYRLLSWNPWLEVFLRGVEALREPLPAPSG